MFDANAVICTDINKAFIELLSPEEILKTSVCRIKSSVVFDAGDDPRRGGLHDPAMGPLSGKGTCITCGAKRDCPGHLGHIELPLPVFHPTLLGSLLRLLRTLCLRCRRLRLDARTASVYTKKFQLIQNDMLAELEQFETLHSSLTKNASVSGLRKNSESVPKNSGDKRPAPGNDVAKRVQLVRLFTKLQQRQEARTVCAGADEGLPSDISECHTAVESWSSLRAQFFRAAMGKASCAHCGKAYRSTIKQAAYGSGIDIIWPWSSEKPFSRATWQTSEEESVPGFEEEATSEVEDGEESTVHGRRGRVLHTLHLQPYQILCLLRAVWSSNDRELVEFLYPMSIKNGWEIFFIRYLPVSANRFRPLQQGLVTGSNLSAAIQSGSSGCLHSRTAALLEIVQTAEKMAFALSVLRSSDPLQALERGTLGSLETLGAEAESGASATHTLTDVEKAKLRQAILDHQGNYKLLSHYSRALQQAVNQYIDSSKAPQQRGKRPTPGIRQWMERKQGAIRQKMMGKRVNFAARTVIAPDNCIRTNEIGIPVEFAKKLTIAEYVTPQSSAYLQKLVENGARVYPGANSIEDVDGVIYDLSVMSEQQRQAKAQLIFAAVGSREPTAPKIVHRHVRDGDVVIMNRQPTLHRASMMAHFVRVLQGWKTFRLMYVNCGSYNADFDGDEMNMHLPQDPTSRVEAQSIVNADCHYITAKNGEPLRGLIQDHVLGGAFLTCRDTFLDVYQYNTLLYVGMTAFVDRGQKLRLFGGNEFSSNGTEHVSHVFMNSTGPISDPYTRLLANRNLPIITEPPAIVKPEKRWTGKQVITSILKTLVDTMARAQFAQDPKFQNTYKGLHFTAKSKTPGDAWGGVLDGDTEESTLVIRNSELLQGVFDKSMFGASSYGLVHLCFEMLGPFAAGMLLSVFAKTFICFLQMRGFSCCTGDFLMTPEGERNRSKMITHCTMAGQYLQEVFVDSINREMGWNDIASETEINGSGNRMALDRKGRGQCETFSSGAERSHSKRQYPRHAQEARAVIAACPPVGVGTVSGVLSCDINGFPIFNSLKSSTSNLDKRSEPTVVVDPLKGGSENSTFHGREYGINFPVAAAFESDVSRQGSLGLTEEESNAVALWHQSVRDEGGARATPLLSNEQIKKLMCLLSASHSNNTCSGGVDLNSFNLWDICRALHLPFQAFPDWRVSDKTGGTRILSALSRLIQWLLRVAHTNMRLKRVVLMTLARTPGLALYFPRVAQLVGASRLWNGQLETRLLQRQKAMLPPQGGLGRIGPPTPNTLCLLPSGRCILGDASLRAPKLYHPSWLFKDSSGLEFENTGRYTWRLGAKSSGMMTEALHSQRATDTTRQAFSPRPNALTRTRLELLAKRRFAGREATLVRLADGFFQAGMGRLTSRNNDLVSGRVTLYKFPFNGFASMITTGAKGSKVNFAMICGMLSQQSLEGKRVPVMVSGKTLPAFGRYDWGARAGGLITDRYLTGLRPQEYFFHCMAGREGLVDTAVKTARSGYLQRCVMKGMEGIIVQYDGTVRDSDGTIVQFLYGEDGIDVSRASYATKLEDLLQNPAILRAKYGSEAKLLHPHVANTIKRVEEAHMEEKKVSKMTQDDEKMLEPLTSRFPPMAWVGSTSDTYRSRVETLFQKHKNLTAAFVQETARTNRPCDKNNQSTNQGLCTQDAEEAKQRLKHLFFVKYAEMLCSPGEAVGCLSAQSMGEPATQMTLNTFHLAGHGAANVTLGIPRLREILQTAGDAKVPYLYIPIKGRTQEEASRNAELVLLGFKRIPLSDVIHAIGVESNVYHQMDRSKNGIPEFTHASYRETTNAENQPRFFWEYETTIQFENLDHFCSVVPKFTPQKILALTVNRVLRDMMRQVNKLMYLYATNYAEEELDGEDDELNEAVERFVLERDIRSQFTRRDMRKERSRAAGVGFGTAKTPTGKLVADVGANNALDLLTVADVTESSLSGKRGRAKTDGGTGDEDADARHAPEDEEGAAEAGYEDNSSSSSSSSCSSNDENEDDGSQEEEDDFEKDSMQSEVTDDARGLFEDGESGTRNSGGSLRQSANDEKDEMSSGRDNDEESTAEDEEDWTRRRQKRRLPENRNPALSERIKMMQSRWKEMCGAFDRVLGVLKTENLLDPYGEELEPEAMWPDTEGRSWKIRPLPEEAFRFLTDLKICRKTWRVVLKFGWPLERCPRRITLLNYFVKIIKKHTLQETPGVRNPRIVGGENTETKSDFEVQCEGSNFSWIQRLSDAHVEHIRVTSNDIRAVLQFFGVEACRSVIIRELNKVFSVYGITVDYRHMSLIADAMTHSGHFRPFSRLGIQHNSSPFLQMSFETSMKFLTEAIERGACDELKTPAGAIVTGKPTQVGSGMCRVLPRVVFDKRRASTKDSRFKRETPVNHLIREQTIKQSLKLKKEEEQEQDDPCSTTAPTLRELNAESTFRQTMGDETPEAERPSKRKQRKVQTRFVFGQ